MITMNKIAKILSVVLSVSLVIGVTVAMLVSAFAVTAPKFSLSRVASTAAVFTLRPQIGTIPTRQPV